MRYRLCEVCGTALAEEGEVECADCALVTEMVDLNNEWREERTMTEMTLIPMDELQNRRLYRVRSRNLVVGVWSSEDRGFVGVREKFGHEYPFTEYHRDADSGFGTVTHMAPTEHVLPDNIDVREGCFACRDCGEEVSPSNDAGRWSHDATASDEAHTPVAVYEQNTALLNWLKPHSDRELDARYRR